MGEGVFGEANSHTQRFRHREEADASMAFRQNEKARVEIRGPGWVKGEKLGVGRDRVVSVLDCPVDSGLVNVKIVSAKHNIYVATPI